MFEADILERFFLSDDQGYSYQIRDKEMFRVCPFSTFYIYLTMSVLIDNTVFFRTFESRFSLHFLVIIELNK